MTFEAKLKERVAAAEGTMAFHFEKPREFNFKAGQHVVVTLMNPPETDAEGNNRVFSLANAPFEKELMVATRMRDTAFKRVLKQMPLGNAVSIEGPYGSFTLHNDTLKPAIFLIGGIGITPVRSILVDATKRKLSHKLFLFYSNRRPQDAAFLEELQKLEKKNPNFKLIATMTEMEKSEESWRGEKGYIDRAMLKKYLQNLNVPIYYVAGPPAMVAAMRKVLGEAGVNDDNIKTEEFAGY